MSSPQFWPSGSNADPRARLLPPEECLAIGGHCWVDTQWYMQGNGVTIIGQGCKHCRARRSGRTRESVEWTMVEEEAT